MSGGDGTWVCFECGTTNTDPLTCQHCFQPRFEAAPPPAGAETGPIDPVPAPPASRRRRPLLLAALVVVVATGAATYAFVLRDDGPHHPKAWDPRVSTLVTFVQDKRGLAFEHPVDVVFMAPGKFQKSIRADETKLSAEDRQDIENAAGMLRSLGLIDEDVDLFESANDLQGAATLAYYSTEDEKIRIRGEELTPAVRATVAHELTHVLQDQHFDLGRLQAEADESDDDQESDVLRGLAEGDAVRIGDDYEASLTEAERKAVDEEQAKEGDSFQADDYPPVLTVLFGAPYALGQQLTGLIFSAKGQAGIDKAFESPPRYDKSLLDPLGYLAGEGGKSLTVPALANGEKEIDHGGFGAFTLYLALAQRLGGKQALAAADRWGGDSFVAYRAAGRVCVRIAIEGEDARGTEAIADALDAWARPTPTATKVERTGGTVVLQACDTKATSVVGGKVTAADLLGWPIVRASIGQAVLEGSGTVSQARCFAARVTEAFTLAQLQAETLPPAEAKRVQEIAAACRGS